MTVTKKQLINGTANFILKEVVPAVNDTALKAIIVAGTKLMQQSENARFSGILVERSHRPFGDVL